MNYKVDVFIRIYFILNGYSYNCENEMSIYYKFGLFSIPLSTKSLKLCGISEPSFSAMYM
jgi:hypothetical protein